MGVNLNSYGLGGVRAVAEAVPGTGDIPICLDTPAGVVRVRLPIEHMRYLVLRAQQEMDAYVERSISQSSISSGMNNSDGSPDEGQSV